MMQDTDTIRAKIEEIKAEIAEKEARIAAYASEEEWSEADGSLEFIYQSDSGGDDFELQQALAQQQNECGYDTEVAPVPRRKSREVQVVRNEGGDSMHVDGDELLFPQKERNALFAKLMKAPPPPVVMRTRYSPMMGSGLTDAARALLERQLAAKRLNEMH